MNIDGATNSSLMVALEGLGLLDPHIRTEVTESMAATVGAITGLKPFPEVAAAVMKILGQDDFDFHLVERKIETDTALTSAVLRVANSAGFGGLAKVKSLRAAVLRLGAGNVKQIVAAAAAYSLFKDLDGLGAIIREHSAAVAALARVLAGVVGYPTPMEAYLCGLMHEVGKLLLIQFGEVNPGDVWDETELSDDKGQMINSDQTFSNSLLAGYVLEFWNFADPIPLAVALQHNRLVFGSKGVGALVSILSLADRIEFLIRNEVPQTEAVHVHLDGVPEMQHLGLSPQSLYMDWDILLEAHHNAIL